MSRSRKTARILGATVLTAALGFAGIVPAQAQSLDPSDVVPVTEANGVAQAQAMVQITTTSSTVLGLWGDKAQRRLGGADRYETAALISQDTYKSPSAVTTVVIATGTDFPDALSAAPLAAKLSAPLLMTQPNVLTPVTKAEIQRLQPQRIMIIGATGAVSTKVEQELKKLLPSGGEITRIGGVDRYETSVRIAEAGWGSGTQANVFFVTGSDFPDALSAGAAAGAMGAPVILVPGNQARVGPQTRAFLTARSTSTVHIVGGEGVVSPSIASDVRTIAPVKTVTRYQGQDRFGTSADVANKLFIKATNTYLANASDFPDALAGAAVAGALGAPLLLTGDSCIPSAIYDANDRLVPADTILLGGTGVLKATVQHGNECMTKPSGATQASFTGMQQLYAKINKARFDAGKTAFRLADTKTGTPAYTWATKKSFTKNNSLSSQQPWVRHEAVAKAPVGTNAQVNYLYNMLIADSATGTRNALLRTYGGARPYLSVGYVSGSIGYATVYVGTTPK